MLSLPREAGSIARSCRLEQQRASVFEHCLLPAALLPLIAEYAATTPEDMWADGLRIHAA
jgi:hypothetical protein